MPASFPAIGIRPGCPYGLGSPNGKRSQSFAVNRLFFKPCSRNITLHGVLCHNFCKMSMANPPPLAVLYKYGHLFCGNKHRRQQANTALRRRRHHNFPLYTFNFKKKERCRKLHRSPKQYSIQWLSHRCLKPRVLQRLFSTGRAAPRAAYPTWRRTLSG